MGGRPYCIVCMHVTTQYMRQIKWLQTYAWLLFYHIFYITIYTGLLMQALLLERPLEVVRLSGLPVF